MLALRRRRARPDVWQLVSGRASVAQHLQKNLAPLTRLTRLFRDTYFDSTLPNWLLARLMMPISTLATNTVQWRRNGRFWAWEGVGCCDGTCTHVWNYAQGMARLFPELERSARVMQDLGVGFDAKTGRVGFRGENPIAAVCGRRAVRHGAQVLSRAPDVEGQELPRRSTGPASSKSWSTSSVATRTTTA